MLKSLFPLKTRLSGILILLSFCTWSQNYSLIQTFSSDLENPFLAKDAAGNVYVYGGLSTSSGMSAYLHKFNPATYQWTQITPGTSPSSSPLYGTLGVSSTTNTPGARNLGACWTDASGNFWLYGGCLDIFSNTQVGDLWKYTAATGEWTWMSGSNLTNQAPVYGIMGVPSSTIHPGSRRGVASWTDPAGNFWLFGGWSTPNGSFNDLWKYDPLTNQWTWVSGSSMSGQPGVYGTQGVPSPTTQPGCRWTSGVSDGAGNFYIFGGSGVGSSTLSSGHLLNDLWKFNSATGEWTWLSGNPTPSQNGVYGIMGIASSTNMPGGRSAHKIYWDTGGYIWVFGGFGLNDTPYEDDMNDLWKYSIASNQWTWVRGNNPTSAVASYGPPYFALPSNEPGATRFHAGWMDASNNLWIYAGSRGDLWKFNNCTPQTFTASASSLTICNGASSTLSLSGAASYTWAGFTPVNTSIVVTPSVTKTYTAGGQDAFGCPNGALLTVSVTPEPTLVILTSQSTVCLGQSVILSAGGANSYTWNTNQVGSSITVTPAVTTSYTVQGTTSGGCLGSGIFVQAVQPLPVIAVQGLQNLICSGDPLFLTATGAVSYTWNGITTGTTVTLYPQITTSYSITGMSNYGCANSATFTQAVAPLPVINIASTSSLICNGQTTTLTAAGAVSYSWSTGLTGQYISVSPTVNTSYSVVGADPNGCINTATLIQYVAALPNMSISSTQSLACSGQSLSLAASGALSFTWSTAQTGSGIIVAPLQNTTYTVTGADANGCMNTATLLQNVASLPLVTLSAAQNTICEGESMTLSAGGADTYSWLPGNLTGSTIAVSPGLSTTYELIGENPDGCSNKDTLTVSVYKCTGISGTSESGRFFKVFPNPNAGEFTISSAPFSGNILVIVNTLGQIVYSKTLEQELTVVSTSLSQGLYYYQVMHSGAAVENGRLLIE